MMQMTVMVMKLAPYGVFCLTARTFSGIGFDAFLPLLKYMAGVMTALAIQGLVVYMAILKGFYRAEPCQVPEKIPACNGLCIFHRNLQCHHSHVH